MSEPVNYELRDRVAAITLDDGKVNALSIPTLEALHTALDRAEADEARSSLLSRPRGYLLRRVRSQGLSGRSPS